MSGLALSCLVWSGLVWSGLVMSKRAWYGFNCQRQSFRVLSCLVWSGLVLCGLVSRRAWYCFKCQRQSFWVWSCHVWSGLVMSRRAWCGFNCQRQSFWVWYGLVCSGLVLSRLVLLRPDVPGTAVIVNASPSESGLVWSCYAQTAWYGFNCQRQSIMLLAFVWSSFPYFSFGLSARLAVCT